MNTLTQTRPFSLPWVAAWAIASTVGLTVGILVTLQVLWNLPEDFTQNISPLLVPVFAGTFVGLGVGLCTGLAQWLVLRQRGTTNLRWLVSTTLGSILGAIVTIAIANAYSQNGDILWVNLAAFALMGAVVGTVQFLMTRDIIAHPVWIMASALGLAGSMALILGSEGQPLGIAGGLLYGVLTAAALWWVKHT